MPVLLYTCTQVKVVCSTLPLGGTLKKVGWKRALLTPAIILTFLVVVAYGTDPGIAPYYLVPWALLTWGWVLGLPCGGHRMLLGGKSGSGRDTVIRKSPCQWISCFRSPLVCSVKRVLGQRGRCPWGSTTVHVCCSAQFSAWYRAPPQICPWSVGFMQNLNSQTGMIFDPPLLSGRSQWLISLDATRYNNNNNILNVWKCLNNNVQWFWLIVMGKFV